MSSVRCLERGGGLRGRQWERLSSFSVMMELRVPMAMLIKQPSSFSMITIIITCRQEVCDDD